jgi:endogenous inhibitor of DNA gyrase (YacG/DUF329 family)
VSGAKSRACATCKRATAQAGNKFFPFCSERCQLIDLGRWLDEEYRIPDLEQQVIAPKPDDEP